MPVFTTADGLDLAYDDLGPPQARPLLLVHGFSSNRAEGWRRTGWYGALERRGQRLLAFDLRGHGESAKPHDNAFYGRARLAGDIVALMDHVGADEADVIGFSLGARLALTAALAAPHRVSNLVLGGVGGRLFEPSPGENLMVPAMLADDPETISEPLLRSFRHFADEQGEDRHALAACAQGLAAPLDRDDLYGLRMPVLVVAGARDELAGDPQALADAIPGARSLTLPGCDHFSAIAHAAFKGGVFDFLDGWLQE